MMAAKLDGTQCASKCPLVPPMNVENGSSPLESDAPHVSSEQNPVPQSLDGSEEEKTNSDKLGNSNKDKSASPRDIVVHESEVGPSHTSSQSTDSLHFRDKIPISSPAEVQASEFDAEAETDSFLLRHIGKKLHDRVRRIGTFNYQNFLSSKATPPQDGREPSDIIHGLPVNEVGELKKLVNSAFQIPFYGLATDDSGRRGVPVILSLVQAKIIESEENMVHYNPNTMLAVQIEYGPDLKWTIHRRILDFLRLHSVLMFHHLQGHLPNIPNFPSQMFYFMDLAVLKTSNREERAMQRLKLAAERKKSLEAYLKALFFTLNMNLCPEICEFLECSTLTLLTGIGQKFKEGYLRKRVFAPQTEKHWYSFLFCWLPRRKYFKTKWFVLRSSYIAYVDYIDQQLPSEVLLCDKFFRITVDNEQSSNPIKPTTITVFNGAKKFELRPDSNVQMKYWIQGLRDLAQNTDWCQSHRFGSFCPIRRKVYLEWLIDGEEYFTSLVHAIESAKDEIFIHGWWVSPETYLIRPAAMHSNYRLDRLLQKKAREGVKIYIVIFKELTISLGINSYHSKTSLEKLHPNIRVQRHPDHLPGGVLYWAHHEKIVVIDQRLAFTGGLGMILLRLMPSPNYDLIDLCFGRYDRRSHELTDYFPKDQALTIWSGMDYSNPRIRDFRNVIQHNVPLIDRKRIPRMPWHDVHCCIYGQSARDLARHFIERWNYVKSAKSMHKEIHIPFLLPKPDFTTAELDVLGKEGTCSVQFVRSACSWSMGTAPELSIYDAYLHFIENARHFIMIENQFLISKCSDEQVTPVKNRIGIALVERIIKAYEAGETFRVIIFLPLLPAFEAAINRSEASSVRMIMQSQYSCISRGLQSIIGILTTKGIRPEQYISFFSLRKFDKLGDKHITEQIYIHSKVMIVDDRVAIMGSANVNDRSMLGVRDSEINIIVEDDDLVDSTLNGQPVKVGRKIRELRKTLLQEHLGLLHLPLSDPDLALMDDVCSDAFYFGRLRHQASLNTQIYRELFHCVPDDIVSSWDEYRKFTERPQVYTMDPSLGVDVMDNLKCIRGSIVLFPTQFLRKEDLVASMLSLEFLLPIEVYI